MAAEEFEELEDLSGSFEELDDVLDQQDTFDVETPEVETSFDEAVGESLAAESATATVATSQVPTSEESSSRFGWLSKLTIYDSLLLVALIAVSLACLLMATELLSFGFSFPWRTSEALAEPLRLPN